MSQARKYELVYILAPEVSEDKVAELHAQVEAAVARFAGQFEKSENWGRRKLAYEIGRHREGIYLLDVIIGGGDLMKEIERRLKVNEQVLRYLVVRVDEELKAADRARARRHADVEHRGGRPAGLEGTPAGELAGRGTDEDEEAEA